MEIRMKKRIFLTGIIMTFIFSLCGCGSKQATTTLIMADVQEGTHPTALACDEFARLVNEKTDGRIEIEVYHGQILGTEAEQIAQVTVGGIDFVRVSSPVSTYYDDIKAFQALYLYGSEDEMWKVLDGQLGTEMLKSEELSSNGIEGLCWISGGSRNFYNDVKPITCPDDLKGLTLRVNTDSMFAFLEKCGAKGVNVSYGDIYNAISDGTIDGAENNWPSYISTGHYKVAPYISVDEHTRIPEMIVVSTETMSKLSQQDQQIIRECATEAGRLQRQWMQEYDQEAIKQAEEAGCQITYLTQEQVAQFQSVAESVNADVSANYIDTINRIKSAQ